MSLSDRRGQWGTIWLALEREKAAHKGLTGASLRHESGADNEKGRLRIIHGNYRRLLNTANSKTLDSPTRTLFSLLFGVIELRLLRYKFRKRTVKVIVDIQVLSLFFSDISYFAALPLGLASKNHKYTRIMTAVRLTHFTIFANNFDTKRADPKTYKKNITSVKKVCFSYCVSVIDPKRNLNIIRFLNFDDCRIFYLSPPNWKWCICLK